MQEKKKIEKKKNTLENPAPHRSRRNRIKKEIHLFNKNIHEERMKVREEKI